MYRYKVQILYTCRDINRLPHPRPTTISFHEIITSHVGTDILKKILRNKQISK